MVLKTECLGFNADFQYILMAGNGKKRKRGLGWMWLVAFVHIKSPMSNFTTKVHPHTRHDYHSWETYRRSEHHLVTSLHIYIYIWVLARAVVYLVKSSSEWLFGLTPNFSGSEYLNIWMTKQQQVGQRLDFKMVCVLFVFFWHYKPSSPCKKKKNPNKTSYKHSWPISSA